jgi:hypothetical protein
MLLSRSMWFGGAERHYCYKCAPLERVVLNNDAGSLCADHLWGSCGAASFEIDDDDATAIGRLSHEQQTVR